MNNFWSPEIISYIKFDTKRCLTDHVDHVAGYRCVPVM